MQLSERQEKTVAIAITILATLVILSTLLGLLWLMVHFLRVFSFVFLPIAVAGIGALVFQPYYDWLHVRLHLPAPFALAAVFLSVLLPMGFFAVFFGGLILKEITDLVTQIPIWWDNLGQQLEHYWPAMNQFLEVNPLGQRIRSLLQMQGPKLAGALEYFVSSTLAAGAGVAHWTGAMLSWVVGPIYFAYFLMAKRHDLTHLGEYLPFLKTATRQDVVFLVQEFLNILVAFFRGQLIIAFLQGLLFANGFNLVGLRYGLALGMGMGFLNVIPYLGSLLGLGITLPLAYFQSGGGLSTLASVLAVFLVVQTIEGYILTPKIMRDRTGLHPIAIIVAVFFWGSALGGIMGMILAIPLTAFLVVLWRLAKERYISELV